MPFIFVDIHLKTILAVSLFNIYPRAQASRVIEKSLSRKANLTNQLYIRVQKKIVIERIRDLIYLKFVATDFFPRRSF